MAIPHGITREHVLAGIEDFEAGVAHHFGPSTKYDLLVNEERYPPKAILGLATRHTTGTLLQPQDFSGGESSTCFRILRELGFTIVPKLDGEDPPGPPQRDVVAWVLQANPQRYDLDQCLSRHTFIYWFCPKFVEQMRVGMPVFIKRSGAGGGIVARGTMAELPVPRKQVKRPEHLRDDLWKTTPPEDVPVVGIQLDEVRLSAEEGMILTSELEALPELAGHPLVTFRQGTVFRLSAGQVVGLYQAWGGEISQAGKKAEEGQRRLVTHQRIERNRKLIEDKKSAFRKEHGRLYCEVCETDFESMYAELWNERAIEAHHLKPLSQLDLPVITTLEDLILVCSNCHKLIHQTADVETNLKRLQKLFD